MSPTAAQQLVLPGPVSYPDCNGEPMSDNTEQFAFIQLVSSNLDAIRPDFVAGDHLWYPVEGRPDIRVAPDVYVAVGRPKGPRGSYKQWLEAGVPLTVVFEWWSPNATFPGQVQKLRFFEQHGVAEFYSWDQSRKTFAAFVRGPSGLEPVDTSEGFVSPELRVRFEVQDEVLKMFRPDGSPFLTLREMQDQRDAATAARDAATARTAALEARLRALGIDPTTV